MTASVAPSRLLVLAYGHGLGDAVLSMPFFMGIRRAWPACRVIYATTAPTADWFRTSGLVDDTIAMRQGCLWRSIPALRRAACEVAVDLRLDSTAGTAFATRLSQAIRAIGFDCFPRGLFFSQVARAGYLDSHHTESLQRLADVLGVPWIPASPPVSEAAYAAAVSLLGGKEDTQAIVALAPGARDDLSRVDKRWGGDRYAALAGRLASEGVRIAVLGSAGERELCRDVAAGGGSQAIDLSGKTSCEELTAVLSHVRLLVANNSGPVHLASALGVSTISFSGGVHLVQWKPKGKRDCVLLRDAACAETLCRTCSDKGDRCLGAISVERVFGEVLAVLNQPATA